MIKNSTDFPYRFSFSVKDINHGKATLWCEKKFGKRWSVIDNQEGVWCCFFVFEREKDVSYDWFFLNKKDAVLFLLKCL